MLTGSPLPELLPEDLWSKGGRHWKHSACLLRRRWSVFRARCFFVLAGGFVFYLAVSAQKIVRLAFNHTDFIYFWLGSVAAEVRGRGSSVFGHIRYSRPEKICVSAVILSVNFFTVHSTGPKCIGSIGDRRGRGREAKSGRPGAFSPGAPLISSLSR